MKHKKDLFIAAVRLVPLDGEQTIPTAVYYRDRKPVIGTGALEQSNLTEYLRDNFKIELGTKAPSSLASKTSNLDVGVGRTPLGIAKDFCEQALRKTRHEIEKQGKVFPRRVLVAEPLSLNSSDIAPDAWLSNYRAAIRSVLRGKFDEIDLMPEPFAVFQYYRYGIRHPIIAQRHKHIAFVLDFGGGTFDVSVIETTNEGDISQSGRNSRPLSASSTPVGGMYINQMIANDLIFDALDNRADKRAIRKAIDRFNEIKNDDDADLTEFRDHVVSFFRSYRTLLQRVEEAKIFVCSGIANWQLDADLTNCPAARVPVPRNPFSDHTEIVEIRLDASRIREIFENRIWRQKLLPAVQRGLSRASQELGGKSISVVLLSGGSSNIRWLKYFIERDLAGELSDAEVLELSENFQEIVAKGLAVECARRYYTGGAGDFRAVTYNRLCLSLDPNGKGTEVRAYRPASITLPNEIPDNGVLLPSSSSLRGLIDKPLRWKTRLSAPPTQYLDYFFLRSSFDPNDIDNLHNLIDHRVHTPSGTKFGRRIEIELTVRGDGTAIPKFIYGNTGIEGQAVVVEGRPFYMDMTFAVEEVSSDSYLGFDFGTSTSAFSFVEDADVRTYTERSKDKSWQEISDLAQVLPYPIAYPLASFMAETNRDGIQKWGRETLECMLTVVAYICYAECCMVTDKSSSSLFKEFAHRSAGPLWNLLRKASAQLGNKARYSVFWHDLLSGDVETELDHAITEIAQEKHGKLARDLNYQRTLGLVGNVLAKAFSDHHIGYFEDVRQQPFSFGKFDGVFRSIQGPSPPFVNLFSYEGEQALPSGFVFLISPDKGMALNLSPLLVSGLQTFPGSRGPEVYMFDIHRRKDSAFGFRSVQEAEEVTLSKDGSHVPLYVQLSSIESGDYKFDALEGLELKRMI